MTRRPQPECRPPIYREVEDVTPEVVAGFVREAIEAGYQAVYLHPRTYTAFRARFPSDADIDPQPGADRWPAIPAIRVIPDSGIPEHAMLALDEPPPMLPWEAP